MVVIALLFQIKILSQYLDIKPPSVSEMVNRLEKAGFVETKHYKG